jgi:hypothetical protein
MSALATPDHQPSQAPASPGVIPVTLVWAPLLVALVALSGSLYLPCE